MNNVSIFKDELKICSYSKKCDQFINTLGLNDHKQVEKWQILNFRNIQNLILNFIYFTPKTKEELKKAINLWCTKKKEAIKKYGDINTWNVHFITDMSYLFSESNIGNTFSVLFSCCSEFNMCPRANRDPV